MPKKCQYRETPTPAAPREEMPGGDVLKKIDARAAEAERKRAAIARIYKQEPAPFSVDKVAEEMRQQEEKEKAKIRKPRMTLAETTQKATQARQEKTELARIGKWAEENAREQAEKQRQEKAAAELRKNMAELKARQAAEKARLEEAERREQAEIEAEKRKLIAKTPIEKELFTDMKKYLGEAEAEKQDDQREQYLVLKRRMDESSTLSDNETKLFDRLRDWADVYLMRLHALRRLKEQEKDISRLEVEKPKGIGGFFKKLVRPLTMGGEYGKLAQLREAYLDHFGAREVGPAKEEAPKARPAAPAEREGKIFVEKKKFKVAREEGEEMMEATRAHAKKHGVSEEQAFFAKKTKKPEQPREVIELAERLEYIAADAKDILPESQNGGGALENGRLDIDQAGLKLNEMRAALKELGGGKVRLDPEFLSVYQAFVQAEEYVAQTKAELAKRKPKAKKERMAA